MKIYFLLIPIIIGIVIGVGLTSNFEQSPKNSSNLNKENLLQGTTILGNPNAKITIVEFGDYQCTACFRFHENSFSILEEDLIKKGTVNFAFRDFPLNGKDSIFAAEAAYCAQDQNKFWEYHHMLYQNWKGEKTGWVNQQSLTVFAQNIGLDMDEFNSCMSNHKYFDRVLNNEKFANDIGINATPTFLIFSEKEVIRIIGSHSIDKFHDAISQLR
tara:strand:+ start:82 stop:726 length:645 start_codon:yes stop_codon:yes gene_type:complete